MSGKHKLDDAENKQEAMQVQTSPGVRLQRQLRTNGLSENLRQNAVHEVFQNVSVSRSGDILARGKWGLTERVGSSS